MFKKILLILISFVFVVFASSFIYLKLVNPNFKVFKIYLGTDVKEIPEISWEDVTSGRLANYISLREKLNIFSKMSTSVIPIDTFRYPNPLFYNEYNFGYIEPFFYEVRLGKFKDPRNQPFKSFALYKTSINSEEYFILFQKWLNKDKTITFLPIIFKNIDDYSNFINNKYEFFPSPIVQIRDVETCKLLPNSGIEYCNWYIDNIDIYNKITEDWLINKILPREISKYPILMIKTQLKI